MTCKDCGQDGQRRYIAGLEVLRHLRPSDHKFVPASRPLSDPPLVSSPDGGEGRRGTRTPQ